MKVEVLDTPRGRIESAIVGAGPVVLGLHGTPGSYRQLQTLAEDLADGYRVVLPSRPGYGRTPIASGRTLEEQADLYAALLDAIGGVDAALIGVSGGGPYARTFASRHPTRTRALVLGCAVHPAGLHTPLGMRLALALPGVAEALAPLGKVVQRRVLRGGRRLERAVLGGLTPIEREHLGPRVREGLVRLLRSHASAPSGVAGMRNDIARFREPLGDVSTSTLIQHGDADVVVPFVNAQHHARDIPTSRVDAYEGAGHLYLITFRERATRTIRAFLDETG